MLEDYRLIWKLRNADTEALRQVYLKYKDSIYTMGFVLLNDYAAAEHLLGDVFVSFARDAARFRLYESVKNYLARCVIKKSGDMLVSDMYKVVEVERTSSKSSVDTDMEPDAAEHADAMLMIEALNKVPLPQREAVTLHLHGGLKFKEIAQVLQVSLNTAQARYRYGLEKLRSVLDGQVE
jgi:RNA polymerase sigma-70 factor (ECF subfamily)